MDDFTKRVIEIIRKIPYGKVMSYGQVADLAGKPRGARQVARILHSMGQKYELPWHRVINSQGKISLPEYRGGAIQKSMLEEEGLVFRNDRIDFKIYRA
ncbi:MAG: MGMT family protein [Firmicutes bacterium]|jgi:methylated-DNA-protein-cysteine methyltransferase-like protein|nr:MGMT family protein [Bacillota bacterium]